MYQETPLNLTLAELQRITLTPVFEEKMNSLQAVIISDF